MLGNRQKIEEICKRLDGYDQKHKIVGLVDREYRNFLLEEVISDGLDEYFIEGRLIWTRGHSIENYFFDENLLRKSFRQYSDITYFYEAFKVFQNVFPSLLRIACAVSLAAYELGKTDFINGLLRCAYLKIETTKITFDFDAWLNDLGNHEQRVSDAKCIIEKYRHWECAVNQVSDDCVRWLCHGHIGFKIIWAGYERCVTHIYNTKEMGNDEIRAKLQKIRRGSYSDRFLTCINISADTILEMKKISPLLALEMIGVKFLSDA